MSTPYAEEDRHVAIRRHLVGVIGAILMMVGIYFYVNPPESGSVEFVQGSCVKSGLILMMTWLAFPQLDKLPIWLFVTVISGLLAVAIRPRVVLAAGRYALLLAPIFIAIWLLRPKKRRTGS